MMSQVWSSQILLAYSGYPPGKLTRSRGKMTSGDPFPNPWRTHYHGRMWAHSHGVFTGGGELHKPLLAMVEACCDGES